MARLTTTLIAAAALVAVAGCAKKRPAELPPAPGPAVDDGSMRGGPGVGNGAVDGSALPGSAADFRRSVQSDTVHFSVDQYEIDGEARAILDTQAQWLGRYPRARITIEGHCDERGTREYNLALGDRRANAAKNYLAEHGVESGRISVISYGKERPVAPGSDEASWAQNRRAVTVVLSQGG